ncbi:MAG: hypothetical protein WC357_02720 [Candidatus Omnitrophota bacterium]|jgi:MFS family permease
MNKITLKWSDIKKLVKDKLDSSFDETLEIDEIDIVVENNRKVGKICFQNESKDGENENPERKLWKMLFLILGILLIIIFTFINIPLSKEFIDKIPRYIKELLWCLGWAAIGIYCALHNSRFENSKRSKDPWHYIIYFGFVFIIATVAAFVVLGTIDKDIDRIYVYAAAFLTGVIVGFSGDRLGDKLNLIK